MGMDMSAMLAPLNAEAGMPPSQGTESLVTTLINQVIAPVIQVLTQLIQSLAAQLGLSGTAPAGTDGQAQVPPGSEAVPSQQPGSPQAGAAPGGAGGSTPAPEASAPGGAAPSSPSTPDTDTKPGDTKPSADAKFFQYKPFSDKDKNVAILLPSRFTGESARVEILLPNGEKVLMRGKYSGTDKASGREVFRFDKQGSDIPDGATVRITLQNGKTREVQLDETSKGLKKTLR
jgi:hypothetical protein